MIVLFSLVMLTILMFWLIRQTKAYLKEEKLGITSRFNRTDERKLF